MSNIKKEIVKGFDNVHPLILAEGIKIACQLLSLQSIKVSDYILNWDGEKITKFNNINIIRGLDAQSAASLGGFAGMGLAIDAHGKLTIVGDFYFQTQKEHRDKLKKILEQILGGACYFAARALIAKAKGQKVNIIANKQTKQLQMIVEM